MSIDSTAAAGIQWSTIAEASTAVPQSRTPVKTMQQEDFLKLLVAQMTTQDPFKPMEDLDSFAQMAQFSALEQAKDSQKEIQALREQQEIIQANSLIGREIYFELDGESTAYGVVQSVSLEAGKPRLVVGDHVIELEQVYGIAPGPVASTGPLHSPRQTIQTETTTESE